MSLCARVFRMSIRQDIRSALASYISIHHDQLIEDIFDFYDDSFVAGNEEDGHYVHARTRVVYVVHPDAEPRRGIPNLRHYWHDGDLHSLIADLDRMS